MHIGGREVTVVEWNAESL